MMGWDSPVVHRMPALLHLLDAADLDADVVRRDDHPCFLNRRRMDPRRNQHHTGSVVLLHCDAHMARRPTQDALCYRSRRHTAARREV